MKFRSCRLGVMPHQDGFAPQIDCTQLCVTRADVLSSIGRAIFEDFKRGT